MHSVTRIIRAGGRDPKLVRCIVGSFILRAAAAGAAELIAFYLAGLEHVDPTVRGSLIIGTATMLFYFAEVSGAFAFGALTDRHGPRRYLLLGPVFGGIAAQVMAIIPAIPTVVLARLFQGLSTAAAIPATLAFLSARAGDDEAKRGRIMSAFEIAAISGMAAGLVTVGIVWDTLGLLAFYPIVGLYVVSLFVFWNVGRDVTPVRSGGHGLRLSFLRSQRALRLVPAWVSVNAVLGVWLTHSALQLNRPDNPNQLLVGGYSGTEISNYAAITLLLFVAGIGAWGLLLGRLGSLRVMSLSLVGIIGLCPALYLLNHSTVGNRAEIAVWLAVSGVALFVGSGFTPAALAYLSRIAEEFAAERGAIMGLYSVLLGVGQAIGAVAGGFAAAWLAVDGMILLSGIFAVCSAVAVVALVRVDREAARRPFPLAKNRVGVSTRS